MVDTGCVKRVRNTIPQKELNDKERRHNLKNAFQLTPNIVEYSQIMLIDDIYTTGSTIKEAIRALSKSEIFRDALTFRGIVLECCVEG